MEANRSFRTSFNGFNREDVVHYIEYMNTKHTNALNQLKNDNQALMEELAQLRQQMESPAEDPRLAELTEKCEALESEKEALTQELADVREQLSQAQNDNAAQQIADQELEAYRRAERAERAAQERAQQIYQQATGTLADVTAQVDDVAGDFKALSDRLNDQMAEMQTLVLRSKDALADAAAKMYAIRPADSE